MYSLIRRALFCLDAETSHELTLDLLGASQRLGILPAFVKSPLSMPTEVMGINFKNPVGLAAGLDKNGDYLNALGDLGFGSVEIGTITPRPQPGNPKPRLFRVPEHLGVINRMGFNNKGVDHLVEQVKRRTYDGVLGINVGKNFDTPVENAADDYCLCIEKVYELADYITVNISSPNTPGLRDLQFGDSLDQLLDRIKSKQQEMNTATGKFVPICVKIAPDMDEVAVEQVAESLLKSGIDGVIATNTTISREEIAGSSLANETGGLSGLPVRERSTQVLKQLRSCVGDDYPIIGVGGIVKGGDVVEKRQAGADLVQVYSGFIYKGPELIKDCLEAWREY